MTTYRIRPLEWTIPERLHGGDESLALVETARAGEAGHYTIRMDVQGTVQLQIAFIEFYNEHTLLMPSVEDAKIAATQDWHRRLLPALEEEIDYKELLKKYVEHIGDCEGIDFLDHWTTKEADIIRDLFK